MLRQHWQSIVIGLGTGILGTALVLASWHLWQDHQALHAVIAWANQVSAQAAKAGGK